MCWHKEKWERFELEIEASFITPAETMDIYILKIMYQDKTQLLYGQISEGRNFRFWNFSIAKIVRWMMPQWTVLIER